MWWQEKITTIKGIGPKKAADFAALNIYTLGDLLEYYPRQDSYLDYSQLKTINQLATDGSKQIFTAFVYRIRQGFGKKKFTAVTVRDATGYAELYFFAGQRYLAQKLKPDMKLLIMGKVKQGKTGIAVGEVNCQPLDEDRQEQALGIMPVYSLTGGLTQKILRSTVRKVLDLAKEQGIPESLPEMVRKEQLLPDRLEALENIHFPKSWQLLSKAKERFIFEELYVLQCGLLYYRRNQYEAKEGIKHGKDGELLSKVISKLPFKLTPAQQAAWQDISLDMQDKKPMHRILQGDVGSGKTVVSALALAKAAENGYQGCLMAPTEILAVQHYETLKQYLEPFGIKVGLLTGGMRAKARRELLELLELGMIQVLIGTHALLQEDVRFKQLSIAITDEQHRFGVEQRAALTNKSSLAPDVLVMTATPIPRTLALTVYGDLDVSIMKGRPPGRKPIQTLCYGQQKRPAIFDGLVRQINEGRQAYVVCSLIVDSEQMAAHSAEAVYEELKSNWLKNIPSALLHGKLRPAEKDVIMNAFAAGDIKVLVSTTVIEVGVNVPNATLMIIENAERFGLAQLHQLRGRVGRGDKQSFCVLIAGQDNPETMERLQVLRDSEDGFYLAERDLQLRGAGQLFGLKQHGLPDLHIADILRDTEIIVKARRLAQRQLEEDPSGVTIKQMVELQFGDRFKMIFNV